jgi:hypothetical protein
MQQWRFRSAVVEQGKSAMDAAGRLVFYFTIKAGKAVVIDAAADVSRKRSDGN